MFLIITTRVNHCSHDSFKNFEKNKFTIIPLYTYIFFHSIYPTWIFSDIQYIKKDAEEAFDCNEMFMSIRYENRMNERA